MVSFVGFLSLSTVLAACVIGVSASVVIKNTDPRIYYHGRWDASPGTWWAGSGFKINANRLTSLAINLGPLTSSQAQIGVSINYGAYTTQTAVVGANKINLNSSSPISGVVRINCEGWQNNRLSLQSITLNDGASLAFYQPQMLHFEFIGDSLSAGQFLPNGIVESWTHLTGEYFKAEHTVIAQPGAALSDMVSYGNQHGMSYQFFQTEDTGYYYTSDHNYTTNWDFSRDRPTPTHLVIHVGANDVHLNVTDAQFVSTYGTFLTKLRKIYPKQPIFVFTPWGWPSASGSNSYYFQGQYQVIVNNRHAVGDKNVYLVDTTGWVDFVDVFPDNVHPNVPGNQKIAGLFQAWLKKWGLSPLPRWVGADGA